METVIFTCTVTGDRLRWSPSDVDHITILNTADINEPLMPQPGYIVRVTALTDTTMTSTLSKAAVDGITVSCIDPLPTLTTIGTMIISLVGELRVCVLTFNVPTAHDINLT